MNDNDNNHTDYSGGFVEASDGAPSTTYTFDCFTQEQVKEINKEIKKNVLKKEDNRSAADDGVVDGVAITKVGKFFQLPCFPLMELLHPWLHQCQIINKQIFGYDISWDFHLDMLNYNVYEENDEYGWHIDASPTQLSDMKLTCLLNLSEEPYEGGEFHMINSKHKPKFTSGMGCVFNSLIAHKVTPVTKGERITLTYWGAGRTWR